VGVRGGITGAPTGCWALRDVLTPWMLPVDSGSHHEVVAARRDPPHGVDYPRARTMREGFR
jgi:hypothetical protein